MKNFEESILFKNVRYEVRLLFQELKSGAIGKWLNDSSTVRAIRNAFQIVLEIGSIFCTSARRTALLKEIISGKKWKEIKNALSD